VIENGEKSKREITEEEIKKTKEEGGKRGYRQG